MPGQPPSPEPAPAIPAPVPRPARTPRWPWLLASLAVLGLSLPAWAGPFEPRPGLYTGALADAAQLQRLVAAGLGTVIDLRTADEREADALEPLARRHGLRVQHLPVATAADLTLENAERLRQALDQAQGQVWLHCSDGDRSGALLALMAHFEEGLSRRHALALGRRAGLSSLETQVQLRLRRLRR